MFHELIGILLFFLLLLFFSLTRFIAKFVIEFKNKQKIFMHLKETDVCNFSSSRCLYHQAIKILLHTFNLLPFRSTDSPFSVLSACLLFFLNYSFQLSFLFPAGRLYHHAP